MQIKSKIIVLFLSYLIMMCAGCSRSRIKLPLEEIDRPISMPRSSARVGLDWSALINTVDFSLHESHIWPVVISPVWLKDGFEFCLPGFVRYYLIKNTVIQDNTIRIKGINSAVFGGLTGATYYGPVGYILFFEGGLNYKQPLNDRLWFASDARLIYQTNSNIYGGFVQAGIGCQLSERSFATIKPSYSIFNPYVNDGYLLSFPEISRYFTLPLLLGVNLTNTVSLYWQSSVVYYRNYDVRYGQGVGFNLTW